MFKKSCHLFLYSALSLTLAACGSMKTRDVNQNELTGIRKIAMASFSFEQPKAATLGADTSIPVGTESYEIQLAMKDVAASLKKKMKWNVLPVEDMKLNPAYVKTFDSKMKGFQMGKVLPQGKLLLAPDVMDGWSVSRMKPAERDELIKALGVDAIAETRVHIAFANSGANVMGIGSRYPQATIAFYLYKKGVEKPVWFEGNLKGDPASESVGKTGFFEEGKVTQLGRASVRDAFDKVNPKVTQ